MVELGLIESTVRHYAHDDICGYNVDDRHKSACGYSEGTVAKSPLSHH